MSVCTVEGRANEPRKAASAVGPWTERNCAVIPRVSVKKRVVSRPTEPWSSPSGRRFRRAGRGWSHPAGFAETGPRRNRRGLSPVSSTKSRPGTWRWRRNWSSHRPDGLAAPCDVTDAPAVELPDSLAVHLVAFEEEGPFLGDVELETGEVDVFDVGLYEGEIRIDGEIRRRANSTVATGSLHRFRSPSSRPHPTASHMGSPAMSFHRRRNSSPLRVPKLETRYTDSVGPDQTLSPTAGERSESSSGPRYVPSRGEISGCRMGSRTPRSNGHRGVWRHISRRRPRASPLCGRCRPRWRPIVWPTDWCRRRRLSVGSEVSSVTPTESSPSISPSRLVIAAARRGIRVIGVDRHIQRRLRLSDSDDRGKGDGWPNSGST